MEDDVRNELHFIAYTPANIPMERLANLAGSW